MAKIMYNVPVLIGDEVTDVSIRAGLTPSNSGRRSRLSKAFRPLPDIITFELAQAMVLLLGMKPGSFLMSEEEFNALDEGLKRHFPDA